MSRSAMIANLAICVFLTAFAGATPVHLRCEFLQNPLGIDSPAPHLSWQSDSPERNWRQSAYRILVASSPERLDHGKPDVWDSGKRESGESVGIAYGGPKLKSRPRYYWSVRVWDANRHVSQSTEPAWWEMGLLQKEDWSANWISWTNPEAAADRAGIRWIWVPGQDFLKTPRDATAVFWLKFKVEEKPTSAALFLLARGNTKVEVNGIQTGAKKQWHAFDRQDIEDLLISGENSIVVTVTVPPLRSWEEQTGEKTAKAAFAALLKLTSADGTITRIPSDAGWQARLGSDANWRSAAVVAELGDQRLGEVPPLPQPAALLRHAFQLSKPVRSARLYVTALGSYRMFINGGRVGRDVLTPEFTDYGKRLLYQSYDVTGLLAQGDNSLSAVLGDGWFGSPMNWLGQTFYFGHPPTRLLAQLELDYTDGTHDRIVTDGSWKAAASPILRSEIYAGETYDARLEQPGWDKPGFDESRWTAATLSGEAPPAAITSQLDIPDRVTETRAPQSVTPLGNGSYVFDMGQNMVGWVTLKVAGAAGARVRLRFAEILNPDGSIYRENLRNADATDSYVLRGGGPETYTPSFTFHGFRYVEVTGYPGTPPLDAITGEVLSSVDKQPTGKLATSSELVNRMWRIGIWGQRGNFLSIPTDCPQRDERLGWMGDAAIFWRTGSYNFDIAAFSNKWMQDVADAQTPEGAFTNVSPDLLRPDTSEGAPGWGDAGIIVPWTAWLQYGDSQIIERHWAAMQRWMDFIQRANPDFLRKKGVGPNFADWLAPDNRTQSDLIATAYWGLIANMMSQMAHATGKEEDAKHYAELSDNIRSAFRKAYIKENGEVGTGTQTSYVLALYTKMAPPSLVPALMDHLVKDIESRNWSLSTGFLGTPFLLSVLSDNGRTDVAYRLLLNETYPSWGYMLSKGATTWWERWDGDKGDPSMNSYNHYAFGSVMAWVYRYVAGIDAIPEAPGFREIAIHPRLDSRITSARGEYDSVYGKIVSDWNGTPNGPFHLKVTIPPNTSANVFLPATAGASVTESGKPVAALAESGSYVVQIGSGSYEFEVK